MALALLTLAATLLASPSAFGSPRMPPPDPPEPSEQCGFSLVPYSCVIPIVEIDARKMPFIARNIQMAIDEGKPAKLTLGASSERRARQTAACGAFKPIHGGECDEYPFASSRQGGRGARVEEVPSREQRCQGGTLSAFYRANKMQPGWDFIVEVTNEDAVATGPYTGAEVAADPGPC